MEQNQLDKGLKKAMKIKESPRLSTNFTFRTMLKVQEAIRLKEQKQEKQMFWATVAASVFLLVGCGVVIGHFWGDVFLAMFTNVFTAFALQITSQHSLLTMPFEIGTPHPIIEPQ